MLRVRDSACSGFLGTVSSGSRVGAGSRCAGDSSAVFLDPGAFSGGTTILWMRCRRNADAIELRLRLLVRLLLRVRSWFWRLLERLIVRLWSRFALAGSVDRELRRSGPSVRLNAHATASESTGIIGSLVFGRSESPLPKSDNSSMGVACVDLACAAVASLALVCSSPRPRVACAAGAVHARRTVSPMHTAHSHNSWSDTVSLQGPRGRKSVKEGVSGPAEDLRPVSEVGAGVNFRPVGGVREQVAGSLPRRQPGTGTRQVRGGVVTPSLHPEVPGIKFVSPDTDWTSGNQWAGRICVEPHGRGFGC